MDVTSELGTRYGQKAVSLCALAALGLRTCLFGGATCRKRQGKAKEVQHVQPKAATDGGLSG